MKLPCISAGTMRDILLVKDAINSSRIVPSYAVTRLVCRVFKQHHFSSRFGATNWIYKSRRLMIHVEIAYDPQIDRIVLDYQYFIDKQKLGWGSTTVPMTDYRAISKFIWCIKHNARQARRCQ